MGTRRIAFLDVRGSVGGVLQTMDASDYAAWYAAAVGTSALAWEVVVHWTKGPRLSATATHDEESPKPSNRIKVDIYNSGTESTRIESFKVEQDGTRFEHAATNIPSMQRSIGDSPVLLEAGGHLAIDVFPTIFDPSQPTRPALTPQDRRLDPRKPAIVYLKSSASRKEIVLRVKPIAADVVRANSSA